MAVEIAIRHKGDFRCEAELEGKAATIDTDAPSENGGRGELMSPTDLVGAALGTCVVTMVVTAAKRAGAEVGEVTAQVSKEMVSEPKRRIGALHMTVKVPNWPNLSDEVRKRLEAAATGCPVKNSLHPDTKLTISFEY